MKTRISRSDPTDHACVSIPSSKSLSHRALIAASLAEGDSVIHFPAINNDTEATMCVMRELGASFTRNGNDILVHGTGGVFHYSGKLADCGESGSTLRFLIPVFALMNQKTVFTGHGKLMQRPQTVYESLFDEKGLLFKRDSSSLIVHGPLTGGRYTVDGNVSSQFISGLLFALPLCRENSILQIREPFESSSYVNLTLQTLKHAGIIVERNGLTFCIPGNQKYKPVDTVVEGDFSQAAFFAELSLISGKAVDVHNLTHDSQQGDAVILDIVRRMGGHADEINNGYRFSGKDIHGIEIDLGDCPDLGPALFALSACINGKTVFSNCGRLRIKESDRIACMQEELGKLGCSMTCIDNTVTVNGTEDLCSNAVLDGHNDHRIVMALSVLASQTDNTVIEGCEAVQKSYTEFFDDLKKTGVKCDAEQ